jgi:hypothetical protein
VKKLAKVSPGVGDSSPTTASFRDLAPGIPIALSGNMRALLAILPSLVACTSENVAPLSQFGPMSAWVSVELGPLSAESGRDVNPRVFVSLDHSNPDCPVFDDDIAASIDGVRPDSFEHGYYDDSTGYGHNNDPICQPPFFSIDRVPAAKTRSTLRIADETANYSLEVDRLFVNPEMTLAARLEHGRMARIDVNDDRQITNVEAEWWVGDETESYIYDVMATVASNAITFRMPSDLSGPGRLEVRVELAAPDLTCNGFSECLVSMKGSQTFNDTLY